jgi:hypothetical protein
LGTTSFGHPVDACKIGVDDMAVVDPQLRVRGVEGLRVADGALAVSESDVDLTVRENCTSVGGRSRPHSRQLW